MKGYLLLVLFMMASLAHGQDVLLAIGGYAPYIDKSQANKGFLSEIVVKAFKKEGLNAILEFKPWKRIEATEIEENQRVSFGWIKTHERSKRWLYSDVIMNTTTVFITPKAKGFKWSTLDDLKPFRIGVSRGYSYGNEFDAMRAQFKIQEAASDEQNIKKLVNGRIDIFPIDPYVGARIIRDKLSSEEAAKLVMVSEPNLGEDGMFAVCSKKYSSCESLLNKFNAGLAKMKSEGTLQSIIEKATALN
jgi:polar amino acid transport system substrate-binding protein